MVVFLVVSLNKQKHNQGVPAKGAKKGPSMT